MKTTPYVVAILAFGMLAAGTIGAGQGAAQTETPESASARTGLIPTPAKYAIGKQAGFDEVTQRLAEQGFEVIGYELDDRRIEVTGLTATGHCLELKFHPVSGKELRRKREDDCRR